MSIMKTISKDNKINNKKTPLCLNWGRGRLIYYQSFTSFAAIFCNLNCIGPREFREYWFKTIGVNILEWNKAGYSKEQIELIANTIDEPISIVKTVFYETLSNRKFRLIEEKLRIIDSVRYCEKCLQLGYHGRVHEDALMAKCPVHGEDLKVTYSPRITGAKWDCAVRALSDVFREYYVDWPGCVSGDSLRIHRMFFASQRRYFEWKHSVASEIGSWTPLDTEDSYESRDCVVNEIDSLLGRLQWIKRLDAKFLKFMIAAPRSLSPKSYKLSKSLSRELTSLLQRIDLNILLDILNTSYLIEEMKFIGVKNDIHDEYEDIITHRSDRCECVWRRGRYSRWTKVPKEEVRYSIDYICPYVDARGELELRWGNPLMSSMFRAGMEAFCYSARVCCYAEKGVFDVEWVSRGAIRKVALVRPRFTLELSDFLTSIQVAIFESYLSDLRSWLNQADEGKDIDFEIGVLPRAFLIEKDGLVDAVLVW